ncbi:MAG: ribonuclease P protein component [Nitrospira sp.]
MLHKKRRISRKEFFYVLGQGKRYNSQHFLAYVFFDKTKNKPTDSRFSFSVSKKVAKNAVDRNKLRRRGYSILSNILDKIEPDFMVLFSFKKGSDKVSFELLSKEVFGLLSQSHVLK